MPEGLVVTGTMVKDYAYCPALPWLKARLGVAEPPTWGMRAGSKVSPSQVASKLGLERPWAEEVQLKDKELGASGTVDLVSGQGRLSLLEVKAFRVPYHRMRHFVAQLKFYALLASRTLGSVRTSYLYHGGDVYVLEVDSKVLQDALNMVEELRAALSSEEPPRAYRSERCASCWFRKVCPAWA